MYRLKLIVVLIVMTVASPVLASGGEKGDVEIGLFAGAGVPDAYGTGVAKLDPDYDALYGLRLGYFFSPRWSLELSGLRLEAATNSEGDS